MPRILLRDEDTYSTYDVQEMLGVKRQTLISWLKAGRVPEPKRDKYNRRMFTHDEVEAIRRRLRMPVAV